MQRIVRSAGNYFRVLGLPQSYKIDQTSLRERVRKLQQEAHPDKGVVVENLKLHWGHFQPRILIWKTTATQEKGGSLEQSAEINEAARNLKCNHKRGLHLWTGPLIFSFFEKSRQTPAK